MQVEAGNDAASLRKWLRCWTVSTHVDSSQFKKESKVFQNKVNLDLIYLHIRRFQWSKLNQSSWFGILPATQSICASLRSNMFTLYWLFGQHLSSLNPSGYLCNVCIINEWGALPLSYADYLLPKCLWARPRSNKAVNLMHCFHSHPASKMKINERKNLATDWAVNSMIAQWMETQFQPFGLLTMNMNKVNQCHYYVYPCPLTLTSATHGATNVKM